MYEYFEFLGFYVNMCSTLKAILNYKLVRESPNKECRVFKHAFLMFETVTEKRHTIFQIQDMFFMCKISEKLYVCTCRMVPLMVHDDDNFLVD